MKCPTDGTTLTMSERGGIEIDYCPECRGVWLDRGELDKIIERSVTQPRPRCSTGRPCRAGGVDVRAGTRPPPDAAGPALRPGRPAALSQEEEGELAQRDLRLSSSGPGDADPASDDRHRVSDVTRDVRRATAWRPLRRTSRATSGDDGRRVVGRTPTHRRTQVMRSGRGAGSPATASASVIWSKKSSAAHPQPEERQPEDECVRHVRRRSGAARPRRRSGPSRAGSRRSRRRHPTRPSRSRGSSGRPWSAGAPVASASGSRAPGTRAGTRAR